MSGPQRARLASISEAIQAVKREARGDEGVLADVSLGHIRAKFPFAFWMCWKLKATPLAVFDKFAAMCKVKVMHFPEWVAPFHADSVASGCCLRLNHVRGLGCTKSECGFNHICFFCGRCGHGAFEKTTVDGSTRYKCQIHLHVLKDFLQMRREYKFGGRIESDDKLAFEIECGITAGLFSSIAVPLVLKLQREVPHIVATPTLRSLGAHILDDGTIKVLDPAAASEASAADETTGDDTAEESDLGASLSKVEWPLPTGAKEASSTPQAVERDGFVTYTAKETATAAAAPRGSSTPASTTAPSAAFMSPTLLSSMNITAGANDDGGDDNDDVNARVDGCNTPSDEYKTPPSSPPRAFSPGLSPASEAVSCAGCLGVRVDGLPMGSAGKMALPCGHRLCRECFRVDLASDEVPEMGLTLRLFACPAPNCGEAFLMRPDAALQLGAWQLPTAGALIRVTDFAYTCSIRPVFRLVRVAEHVMSLIPRMPEYCSCNELHLADVHCESCAKYYCQECFDKVHPTLERVMPAPGGGPHVTQPVTKIHDRVFGLPGKNQGLITSAPMCPEHRTAVTRVSANDVMRGLHIAAAAADGGDAAAAAPGLPEPLGCDECERCGRHTGHTLRSIEATGRQVTAALQNAVEDACRSRLLLDHVVDMLERSGRPPSRRHAEQLRHIKEVRSALERVGQDVGARLLEQPLHRRAIIGVALDFGL